MDVSRRVKKVEFMDYLYSNAIQVFSIHDAIKIFGKPEKYVLVRLTPITWIKGLVKGFYYVNCVDARK